MSNGPRPPKIGVALSSGMSLAFGHIGVFQALEEAEIPISVVSGCSGGSFIAAMYTSGMTPANMAQRAKEVNWRSISNLHRPRMGFFSNEKLERYLEGLIGGPKTFEDLELPLKIVTVDLMTGEEVVLSEGAVTRAVRASCSVPQLFAPVEYNGRLLCDGGVLNKLPTQVARDMGADLVISVDVGMHSRQGKVPTNVFGVIGKVLMLIAEDRTQRERELADVLIAPNLSGYTGFDFESADDKIAIGKAAMEDQLPHLRSLMEQFMERQTWKGRIKAWWTGDE